MVTLAAGIRGARSPLRLPVGLSLATRSPEAVTDDRTYSPWTEQLTFEDPSTHV